MLFTVKYTFHFDKNLQTLAFIQNVKKDFYNHCFLFSSGSCARTHMDIRRHTQKERSD